MAPPSAEVTPTSVLAGGTVTFPAATVQVANAGNRPALAHPVAFYISAASKVEDLPRAANGTIDTTTTGSDYTRQLAVVSMPQLGAGATEDVASQTLTIPADTPLDGEGNGVYYLYAYVDSTRVVSELNENDNIIQGGPIAVLAGPDLVAPVSAGVTKASVSAGGTVTFPAEAASVPNAGNRRAGAHSIGFYISAAPDVTGLPRAADGTIDTTSTAVYTRLLALVSMAPLEAGSSETVSPRTLTIPVDIPRPNDGTGSYYLYAYVDSTLVVSELNEDNNIMRGGPVSVLAPVYGFLGLQTPCSGMTCDKTGTLPLAWQFSRGSVAVDSALAQPQVTFFSGCPAPPNAPVAAVSNPASAVTSGNSGWQYFPSAGMIRPQYTWQLNFDSTGLPRGACYTAWIEVLSTGQVVGSADPKPIGPLYITPR